MFCMCVGVSLIPFNHQSLSLYTYCPPLLLILESLLNKKNTPTPIALSG